MNVSDIILQVNRAHALNTNLHLITFIDHDSKHTTLLYFSLINKLFIYGLFPMGILLNICLAAYDILSHKPFYTTTTALSNIISLVLYLLNLITPPYFLFSNYRTSNNEESLVVYSTWTCRVYSFAFHMSTSVASWSLVYLISDLKSTLRTSSARHFSKLFSFTPLLVVLTASYSIDLLAVDKVTVKFR